jgi:hypothetical protein
MGGGLIGYKQTRFSVKKSPPKAMPHCQLVHTLENVERLLAMISKHIHSKAEYIGMHTHGIFYMYTRTLMNIHMSTFMNTYARDGYSRLQYSRLRMFWGPVQCTSWPLPHLGCPLH